MPENRIYLGDYLGHILRELLIARLHQDLEIVRISQDIYAKDPILKKFTIPRFRLPNVTIEIPVSIDKIEESLQGISPYAPKKIDIVKILDESLRESKLSNVECNNVKIAFQKILDNQVKRLPRIKACVVSGEMAKLSPSEHLTKIKIEISEEGYEWVVSTDDDGNTRQDLVPE